MRTGALISLLILLGGCEGEQNFDERYEDAAATIENQANSIDRELENSSAQEESAGNSAEDLLNNRQ